MPQRYDNLGVSFQFPDNWILEETETPEQRSVSVYSPGGAFWTVVVHAPAIDPARLVETAASAMRQEYDNLDAVGAEETVAGHRLAGQDLNFYCLDLTNTALIRGVRTPAATLLIFCQADDREFERIHPVFRAMTASLLSDMRPEKPGMEKPGMWPAT